MDSEHATNLPYAGTLDQPSTREELRRLLTLSAPIVALMLTRMLMGFVDFAMVSRLGTSAQAAISPATILVFNVLVLGWGAATSIQTFAAQAIGRGDKRDAVGYGWQVLYLGGAFFLLSWPASQLAAPLWRYFGAAPEVQAEQIAYCETAFWCMGFSVIAFGLEGFFNGIQRPGVALASAFVALLVNVAANYVLIFGHFGFPALGIKGAAYATVLAWSVRAAICIAVLLSREFREEYKSLEVWRPDWSRLKGIFRLGGWTSVQFVLDIGSWTVFLSVLMVRFGSQAMAASNIGLQLMHLSFMPAIGMGIAVATLVGHAIGEGRPDLTFRRARLGMATTGIYMGLIGLIFVLGREPLLRLFTEDKAVIALGATVLLWAAAFQIFDALGIVYSNALRGAGDTRWPAVAVVVHCWGIFIAGGFYVAKYFPGLGISGPWMMATIYITLLGLVLRARFIRGAWRKIDIFKKKNIGDSSNSGDTERASLDGPTPTCFAPRHADV